MAKTSFFEINGDAYQEVASIDSIAAAVDAGAATATTKAAEAAASAVSAASSASSASTSASTATTKASEASSSANAAAASAAALAAGYTGTSTTSLAIGTGSKSFTTQSGKLWVAGTQVIASSDANPSNFMHGIVTSYSSTTLVVNVTDVGGSGTLADWTISLSGSRGSVGATGADGQMTGPGASVDGEVALFNGTGGVTLKRASQTGILKATSGVLGTAASGTDYAPATSGTAILKGNGSGGFSSAASGTDYAPATSGTAILKGNGSGGFSSASGGTDYYNPGGTDVAVADGGTGSSTASGARTNLGLGTAATQNTGTSGANVPLLSAANTFGAPQTADNGALTSGAGSDFSTKQIWTAAISSGSTFTISNPSGNPATNTYVTIIVTMTSSGALAFGNSFKGLNNYLKTTWSSGTVKDHLTFVYDGTNYLLVAAMTGVNL